MQGVAVTFLTEDKERQASLQHSVETTQSGRNVFSHVGFPTSATDPILRQLQDVRTEVVLVDIDPARVKHAIDAIELIHANTTDVAIFAVGPMTDPATIVSAMRAGAREYLERNASAEAVVEAFYRVALARFAAVTVEAQRFWNPGFNRDRGPVTVYGLRLHMGL